MWNPNSDCYISGHLDETPVYSHTSHGEEFYKSSINCKRSSGKIDKLPIIFSEVYINNLQKGTYINTRSEIRSTRVGFKSTVYIFADITHECEEFFEDFNEVSLKGELVKKFKLKETNNRIVISFSLKVMKLNGTYSFINCCAFGRTAMIINNIELGEMLDVFGRFQERTYLKNTPDGVFKGTTYEVCVSEIVKGENQ